MACTVSQLFHPQTTRSLKTQCRMDDIMEKTETMAHHATYSAYCKTLLRNEKQILNRTSQRPAAWPRRQQYRHWWKG